jgi:hypothetical protein
MSLARFAGQVALVRSAGAQRRRALAEERPPVFVGR